VDCQIYGIDPAGHHEMNMIWHVIDAVLLFWVLLQATGYLGRSFMVAALFALHPINVEAVAWVAERKTLLSTFSSSSPWQPTGGMRGSLQWAAMLSSRFCSPAV